MVKLVFRRSSKVIQLFTITVFCAASVHASTIGGDVSPDEVNLTVEQKRVLLESRERGFQALNEKIRDPFVTLGPDGYYYLTGTTAGSHWGEKIGIRIWKSWDLAEWEDLGFVWDIFEDGEKNGTWHLKQPMRNPNFKNPYAVWAPEIHYLKGTWWVTHSLNVGGHGVLKSETGKPEGPYSAPPYMGAKGIDGNLFEDVDGTLYYLYQADLIAKMDPETSTLLEPFQKLQHDGNHPLGYEGVLMMRLGDHYVHIASGRYGYEPVNSYDLYYAVSDTLKGKYSKRRKMLTNAGHGNIFQDKNGDWWATAFDHQFTDEWTLWLVPIEVEITENDVLFSTPDSRFMPTEEDHKWVEKLSKTGVPPEWEGKTPWWRPEEE